MLIILSFLSLSLAAYKLPPLTVAILGLLSLVAFMLLMCLLSCLYTIHKRNEKNRKLMLIAQQAGKGDGEAFRQVTSCHTSIFLHLNLVYLRLRGLGERKHGYLLGKSSKLVLKSELGRWSVLTDREWFCSYWERSVFSLQRCPWK